MGLMDELKRLARPYEDEDDYEEELEEETPVTEEVTTSHRSSRRSREEREPRETQESSSWESRESRESARSYRSPYDTTATTRRPGKVVNINTTTQLQVVLVKPEKFENASDIADHLREGRTVVLNLETTQKEIARRLVDFLSGVAYALEGKIKKISAATYIITPFNVDIIGDLIDELENNGLYF